MWENGNGAFRKDFKNLMNNQTTLGLACVLFGLGIMRMPAGIPPLPRLDPREAAAKKRAPKTVATAPLGAHSFVPGRLAHWTFNQPGWLGEAGQKPLLARNITQVPSFDGFALEPGTNGPAALTYRAVEANGSTNFNCEQGSIRLWYKPAWTSLSRGGKGPGAWERLWEVGAPEGAEGGFAWSIDPGGDNLVFTSKDGAGKTLSISGKVSLGSVSWAELTLTFSTSPGGPANRIAMFQDGTALTNQTTPYLPLPPARVRSKGFTIGGSADGTRAVRGMIDEVEVFNYEIGGAGAGMNGYPRSASVSQAPLTVHLRWRSSPNMAWRLQRRLWGITNWTDLTDKAGWSYEDADAGLRSGQAYEYSVAPAFAGATPKPFRIGVNLAAKETRGRVVLLVDDQMSAALANELGQLQQDLIGDGWKVLRHDVPRHDDKTWAKNPPNILKIKSLVTQDWRSFSNDLKTVFIIGHVAIPYSGFAGPDGHSSAVPPDHQGAWPADLFYADMHGLWTDKNPGYTNRDVAEQTNLPGDGKFDQDNVPPGVGGNQLLELSVGRVDFARLPLFQAPPAGVAPQSEIDLLKRYFAKDHRYRLKQTVLPLRSIVTARGGDGKAVYQDGLPSSARLFGFDSGQVLDANPFTDKWDCTFAFVTGWGSSVAIAGNDLSFDTPALTDPAKEPPVAFWVLGGSWFGDWNLVNDFLRATLATPNYGLAAVWRRVMPWHFECMALGGTTGDGLLQSFQDSQWSLTAQKRELTILGDPTLRLNYTAPPAQPKTSKQSSGGITLSWTPSPEPDAQYWVYRSTGKSDDFVRLTPAPIQDAAYSDNAAGVGQKTYLIKAVQLVQTGSGSFTNLSQGAFVFVP